MKSLILMLALSIGASAAVAGENPATYNTITGELDIPTVIVDDGVEEIDNVTLQNIERLSGGYLFEYIPPTDCLSIAAPPSTCEGGPYLISTPKEYECAVENFQVYPKNCISPDLYVTAFAFQDPKNKKLYANGFAYAWANSSTNAARYLQMNQKWGQGSATSRLLRCSRESSRTSVFRLPSPIRRSTLPALDHCRLESICFLTAPRLRCRLLRPGSKFWRPISAFLFLWNSNSS